MLNWNNEISKYFNLILIIINHNTECILRCIPYIFFFKKKRIVGLGLLLRIRMQVDEYDIVSQVVGNSCKVII